LFSLLSFIYFSSKDQGKIVKGPWIINPEVPPDTTPEQITAGVAPEGVVIVIVLPVMFVNKPVFPVTVAPETLVLKLPLAKLAVVPVTVAPVREVNAPDAPVTVMN
jgi:hypothetical protein